MRNFRKGGNNLNWAGCIQAFLLNQTHRKRTRLSLSYDIVKVHGRELKVGRLGFSNNLKKS